MRKGMSTYLLIGLLAVVGCLVPRYAEAQQSIIRGTVVASTDGESLQGVNIALYQENELVTGTVSGSDGVYALASIS